MLSTKILKEVPDSIKSPFAFLDYVEITEGHMTWKIPRSYKGHPGAYALCEILHGRHTGNHSLICLK